MVCEAVGGTELPEGIIGHQHMFFDVVVFLGLFLATFAGIDKGYLETSFTLKLLELVKLNLYFLLLCVFSYITLFT